MRILMLPADKGGCGLYRAVMPGRAVLAEYPDTVLIDLAETVNVERNAKTGRVVEVMPDIRRYDLVIIQRPMTQDLFDTVIAIQKQHVPVCVELDDDIARVDAQNQAWSNLHPKSSGTEKWDWLIRICKIADWMTVSTPSLARYGRTGRVSVIRNAVPVSLVQHPKPPSPDERVRIGWSGTVATHPSDLQVTHGAVSQVVDATGCVFRVVGDGIGIQRFLSLSTQPEITGWVALSDYPIELARLDVGIVPLADTPFNRGKSFLKGLELAALGIPFVASPLAEYQWLAEQRGIGVLARRPRDWRRELTRLVTDTDYRLEVGARYRQTIAERDTITERAHEWRAAWQSAAEVTRAAALAT